MAKAVRVIPNPAGGWDVKEETTGAQVHFQQQSDAIEYGRRQSRSTGAEFYVHRRILHLARTQGSRPTYYSHRGTGDRSF